MTEETALYRLYDADGRLLYIGVAKDVGHRSEVPPPPTRHLANTYTGRYGPRSPTARAKPRSPARPA